MCTNTFSLLFLQNAAQRLHLLSLLLPHPLQSRSNSVIIIFILVGFSMFPFLAIPIVLRLIPLYIHV